MIGVCSLRVLDTQYLPSILILRKGCTGGGIRTHKSCRTVVLRTTAVANFATPALSSNGPKMEGQVGIEPTIIPCNGTALPFGY